MMKYLLLAIAVLFFKTSVYAQNEQQQIELLLNTQKDAWNNGDMEGYMNGYWQNDSLIFVGSSGITYGWYATLQSYKKAYPDQSKMGKLNFIFEQVEILNKMEAFVLGKWALKRADGDKRGFFTLRLRKIAGSWKVILDHSS